MSFSRRRFLRSAAVVSAAFALKPGTFVLAKDSWSNSDVITEPAVPSYTREMFEPYVGDTFRVRIGKQQVDLKLEALTDVKPSGSRITTGKIARTDCFSMKFHAAKRLPASATVHTLNHDKLGSFDLFMVQSRDKARFLQTAIINHVA